MAAGRPKKTLSDLPKGWKSKVLALAAKGGSDVEIRCLLDCMGQECWERLLVESEEFQFTIKKAHILCQNWWESQGRKGIRSKFFQTGLWTMNMKNRFGWKDKTETEHTVSESLANLLKTL